MIDYDLYLPWEECSKLSDFEIFRKLDDMYPERKFYSMSIDWKQNPKYHLKCKGSKGDLLVGWKEWEK